MIKIKIWNYENVKNEGEINNGCFIALVPYKIIIIIIIIIIILCKVWVPLDQTEMKGKKIWINKKKKDWNWSKV